MRACLNGGGGVCCQNGWEMRPTLCDVTKANSCVLMNVWDFHVSLLLNMLSSNQHLININSRGELQCRMNKIVYYSVITPLAIVHSMNVIMMCDFYLCTSC